MQAIVFGSFSARVWRGSGRSAEQLGVQDQLAALAEENAQLRRLYKHLENRLTVAAEELSGELLAPA